MLHRTLVRRLQQKSCGVRAGGGLHWATSCILYIKLDKGKKRIDFFANSRSLFWIPLIDEYETFVLRTAPSPRGGFFSPVESFTHRDCCVICSGREASEHERERTWSCPRSRLGRRGTFSAADRMVTILTRFGYSLMPVDDLVRQYPRLSLCHTEPSIALPQVAEYLV